MSSTTINYEMSQFPSVMATTATNNGRNTSTALKKKVQSCILPGPSVGLFHTCVSIGSSEGLKPVVATQPILDESMSPLLNVLHSTVLCSAPPNLIELVQRFFRPTLEHIFQSQLLTDGLVSDSVSDSDSDSDSDTKPKLKQGLIKASATFNSRVVGPMMTSLMTGGCLTGDTGSLLQLFFALTDRQTRSPATETAFQNTEEGTADEYNSALLKAMALDDREFPKTVLAKFSTEFGGSLPLQQVPISMNLLEEISNFTGIIPPFLLHAFVKSMLEEISLTYLLSNPEGHQIIASLKNAVISGKNEKEMLAFSRPQCYLCGKKASHVVTLRPKIVVSQEVSEATSDGGGAQAASPEYCINKNQKEIVAVNSPGIVCVHCACETCGVNVFRTKSASKKAGSKNTFTTQPGSELYWTEE